MSGGVESLMIDEASMSREIYNLSSTYTRCLILIITQCWVGGREGARNDVVHSTYFKLMSSNLQCKINYICVASCSDPGVVTIITVYYNFSLRISPKSKIGLWRVKFVFVSNFTSRSVQCFWG